MSKIVLIHGAWHNGACWNKVGEILEREGHEVYPVTIPGNGKDDDRKVSYDDYIAYVQKFIEDIDGKVVVLGHSSAGHIMQNSLGKVAHKLEKVIFNNAWILPEGKSQFDMVPEDIKNGMIEGAKQSGVNAIPVDAGFVRGMLATEADDATFNELMDILVPQPLTLMETAVNSEGFKDIKAPLIMLFCKKDASLPPGAYAGMFNSIGGETIIEVDCDHEGLFTAPDVYTEGLLKCLGL